VRQGDLELSRGILADSDVLPAERDLSNLSRSTSFATSGSLCGSLCWGNIPFEHRHARAVHTGDARGSSSWSDPQCPSWSRWGVLANYRPWVRTAWLGPSCRPGDVADVPRSAAPVTSPVVVDLSAIRRISRKGFASSAVPYAAGSRAPSADLFVRRRKAAVAVAAAPSSSCRHVHAPTRFGSLVLLLRRLHYRLRPFRLA
jgi:hypothetical protein